MNEQVRNTAQGAMSGYDLPVYDFVAPQELKTGKPIRHKVAIVGGGLTGLTMACDLAERGIRAVLLDDDNTVGVRGLASRGVCMARKSLEIFDRFGTYDRVREQGSTWRRGRVMNGDRELYNFEFTGGDETKQPPFINLQQYFTEWYLVDRIRELGNVELRWQNTVTDVRNNGDHAVIDVETPEGSYTLEADWVVAADGAHSKVRDALGLTPDIEGYGDKWCITDVRLPADAFPLERWIWIEAPFNEGRGVWQHLMSDNVWRLDFQMAPDSDPEVVSDPEVACERLRRRLGNIPFELVWVGPWTYRKFVMDGFRHGRVLFIGDAAHLMNPFGARGGNSGIQDADNLGWKLALVAEGKAPEALIDTYDEERQAAAHFNIMTTHRSAEFMMPKTEIARAFRKAVLGLTGKFPFARALVNGGRLSDPFVYADSSLTTNGGEAAANPPVEGGPPGIGHLFDLTKGGARFLLLWWPGEKDLGSDLSDLAAREPLEILAVGGEPPRGEFVHAADPAGKLAAAFRAGPGDVVLLRPDQHVAAHLSNPTSAEIARALDKAMARLA